MILPRPKSFGAKLLLLFVLVVATAQLATWLIVSTAHQFQARTLIDEELERAAWAFTRIVAERNKQLASSAATAARDYAFKQLFAGEIDVDTLRSALPSLQISTDANIVSALSLDARIIASTARTGAEGNAYALLVARADEDPNPIPNSTSYGYIDGELYSLAIAPVRAPDVVAWLVIGFKIDADFAKTLKQQTGIEVTVFDQSGRALATTLPPPTVAALARSLQPLAETRMSMAVPLAGETALATARRLAAGDGRFATLVLQYSLDEKLRPARSVENLMLGVALGSLLLAIVISRAFARRLAQPIVELVGHTRRIARGDYSVRNKTYRLDELGRLSQAFDQMALGLDERDRTRDLLNKNVSPEVAAQLLRDGAALGGEEREVTILFADLRGFTPMSEKLTAPELVALLNRYLDRMSAEIEAQGGIVDKYIGDAIMALFGAPIAQADAAARAVAAARAMEKALVPLNAELAAEGRPPLGIGVGINTARVVAGNIGSQRRLNYSVIGDGVNVASRLQAETRKPEFRTNIIVSAATLAALRASDPRPDAATAAPTLRPLGAVQVKGRAQPVDIFAVES